jgi:hypothetical protein
VYTLAEAEMIVPRHKLATPRSPDGIRLGACDERVDYDTFHDRKSMYKLKSNDIEDDGRERKHDELRAKRRESQGGIASSTRIYSHSSTYPLGPGLGSGFTT